MSIGFAAEVYIIVMLRILMAKEEAQVLMAIDLDGGTQVNVLNEITHFTPLE